MSRQTVRILLVDDDEEACVFIQDILEDATHVSPSIKCATSPEAALALLRAERFEVLIIDHNLGATTGIELLAEIRRQGHDVPAILMSGFGSRDMSKRARQAGFRDYISKQELKLELLERAIRLASSPVGLALSSDGSFPIRTLTDGDMRALLGQVLKLNQQFIEATHRSATEAHALTEEVKGMRVDIKAVATGATRDSEQTQKTLLEHVEATQRALLTSKAETLAAIEAGQRHVAIKVLDWIKDNRALAIGIGVAILILILLGVLVSQTINPTTINQLRTGSATEARP